MQLHHLPLKRARHHPLAQAFEAVHLGLHQTSAVIAAPLFPDAAPQSVTGSQRFVARMRSHQGRLPRLGVLARGDHRLRISLGNRRMARLGVVGTVPTDAGNRLIGWYLLQQLEQHGRIAHAVVGHLDGPDLQRVGINTQVQLAPLAPVLGPVLLAFPFAFAKERNAGAVHQQFQCGGTGSVGQLYLQSLLASAHGAVVGHPPVQACQMQQAFNHAQALTQGQTEQALDAQTELDGCVGEDVLAPAFAAGWGVPLHAFVQPDCQRPSGFERGVVLCPVGGLVAGLGPLRFTHVSRLPAQRTGFVQQSRLGAIATLAPSVYRRLQLSRAKHPSLTGHSRMAKRLARLLPGYHFDEQMFFKCDNAPLEIQNLRRQAFFKISEVLKARHPLSIQASATAREDITDMQFIAAYRVPFQFSPLVQAHLKVGSFLQSAAGVHVTDLDGQSFYDLTGSYGVNVFGAGLLGGIGFTMSIFITNLAFTGEAELINASKIAILLASVTAGTIGFLWLMLFGGNANLSSKQRDPAP